MSNINPNNISVTFPIAGQDNDSQGFRDNFNNIKTNLTTAKTELEDIQAKALLKSALTGTSLDNDGAGNILQDLELKDMSATTVSKGTLTGAVAIDFSAGHFQTVKSSGTLEPAFSNWPATTKYGAVTVEFDMLVAHKITLPTQCTIGVSELADYVSSSRQISFASDGKYRFKFSTIDAGTTIAVEDLNRSPNRVHGNTVQLVPVPGSDVANFKTVGVAGNKAGMIAVDTGAIYVCTADYDGSANIWKKVALVASS